jgi:hypothetical protein
MNPALKWLIPLIFVLTLVAALAGLWPVAGTPYPLTSFRGEEVTINARDLYTWDTVSSAAQMQANDLVMLVLGLPLLALSFWLARRGSLRGRLLLHRRPWGYLLASVGLLKFLTLGLAVSLMGLNMARVGVPVSAVELVVFPAIALANLVMVGLLLRNIHGEPR